MRNRGDGMEQFVVLQTYLSSKGCIHRDIAARNVLVTAGKVAKVSDFGLCRLPDESTYTTRGGRLPIRWMAPESLARAIYSTKSDVFVHLQSVYSPEDPLQLVLRRCTVGDVGAR